MDSSEKSKKGFWLDPRTKIYLLVMFSIVMLNARNDTFALWFKPALACIPSILLFSCGRRRGAAIYLIAYYACWWIDLYILQLLSSAGKMLVALITQMATRWMPGAMMGYYFFASTKVNEFTLAMYRIHLPDAIVGPSPSCFDFSR